MSIRKSGVPKLKSKPKNSGNKATTIKKRKIKVDPTKIISREGTYHRGRKVKNLASINRAFGNSIIDKIEISKTENMGGFLKVTWDDKTVSSSDFASYSVLQNWLSRKRNLSGVDIYKEDTKSILFTV